MIALKSSGYDAAAMAVATAPREWPMPMTGGVWVPRIRVLRSSAKTRQFRMRSMVSNSEPLWPRMSLAVMCNLPASCRTNGA